ncbi:MAG: hypothetical protein IJ665_08000 [Phocaeicola sp.]|nr:hypothetical protein [Phocaeicola sp.]
METRKQNWESPVTNYQEFTAQQYISSCVWRATLHCGIYGNSSYRQGNQYVYLGMPHGEACQNTVVTVSEDKNGKITVTGQEVPKGSVVTYATEPELRWGERGVGAPSAPSSSERGALYSYATWNSNDINGTGNYIHLGYVASWEEYPDGTSNVS